MLTRMQSRGDRGFSLIETLAALLVFSLVTLGIVPLILSSIRGTTLSRSLTIGRNAASEAMERIRGLPFRVDYTRQPAGTRVDFLDMFYPDAVGTAFAGQSYSNGLFTTVCTTTSANPACQATRLTPELSNLELIVSVCFLETGNSCIDTPGARKLPTSNYVWDPGTGEIDEAPEPIVELGVQTRWTVGPATRTFDLRTLLTDRDFGGRDVRATASIDHIASVLTNLEDPGTGATSNILVTIGAGEATIEATDIQSLARQRLETGRLRLADTTDPENEQELSLVNGASAIVEAPPDPLSPTTVADTSVTLTYPVGHPQEAAGTLAFVEASNISGASAAVGSELPTASGTMSVARAGVTNPSDRTELQLDSALPFIDMSNIVSGPSPEPPSTAVTTNTLANGVDADASLSVGQVEILPTTFIDDPSPGNGIFDGTRAVIVVEDITASVDCDASATGGTAEADWVATLGYWADAADDDENVGDWQPVPLSSTLGSDPLAGIPNTVVYEAPSGVGVNVVDDPADVYLFPVDHGDPNSGGHSHAGYLDPDDGWSSTVGVSESVADGGRTVSAGISGALSIRTTPVHTSTNASALNLSLISLSCSADDQR